MTTSTGRVGVFLLPLAVLLPLGVFALLRRSDPFGFHTLILLAVVTAPIAATLKGQPFSVQRVVFMFPFAALIATYGLQWVVGTSASAPRGSAAMVLMVGIALQFAVFYRDYFTHYKLRSAFYYDPVAFVDVAAYLTADEQAPLIYLSTELDDVGAKWRYYTGPATAARTSWPAPALLRTTAWILARRIPAACWPSTRKPPRWRRSRAGGCVEGREGHQRR